MGSRPIRPRADCPGCSYRHYTFNSGGGIWFIHDHNAPRFEGNLAFVGLCPGSGAVAPAPVEPAKGPGSVKEGKGLRPRTGGEGQQRGDDGGPRLVVGEDRSGDREVRSCLCVLPSDSNKKAEAKVTISHIPWPKIARLQNETMVITEKIDGSNACVQFQPFTSDADDVETGLPFKFAAQSRTRLITPTSDNHGFAAWAYENQESLFADLGFGVHFGEWWGAGIQRRYGLDHKRFSLFNTHRWDAKRGHFQTPNLDVVPLLWTGPVDVGQAQEEYRQLRWHGSMAAPFDNPEGIVVYLTSGVSWKLTDAAAPKGPKDQDGNVEG